MFSFDASNDSRVEGPEEIRAICWYAWNY